MGYIYLITNKENGKQYIGKTAFTIENRWKEHCKNFQYLRDDMPLHKAMLKYGVDCFSIEEVEQCDNTLLDERERYWINYYDTYNNGYNATLGGEGAVKFNQQEITELWSSGKTIAEICEIIGAERHTISRVLSMHGVTTQQMKERGSGRPVLQYSLDGNFIRRYSSITLATQNMGKDNISNIRSCCNKTSTSAYNYLWKYEDDDTPIDEFVSRQKKTGKGAVKMVEQYSLDGEYIQTFSSCREAARSIGAPYHVGINSCCLGKQKTAYGFKWKYAGEV